MCVCWRSRHCCFSFFFFNSSSPFHVIVVEQTYKDDEKRLDIDSWEIFFSFSCFPIVAWYLMQTKWAIYKCLCVCVATFFFVFDDEWFKIILECLFCSKIHTYNMIIYLNIYTINKPIHISWSFEQINFSIIIIIMFFFYGFFSSNFIIIRMHHYLYKVLLLFGLFIHESLQV